MKRGLFIAVDGVDGCGKTTFAKIVEQQLWTKFPSERVIHVHQPGATPFGAEVRRIVKSKEFPICPITERLLFAADAAEFYVQARKWLDEGKIIVSDRFTAVTDVVYGTASGTPVDIIFRLQEFINPVKADLLMPFHCSYKTAEERRVRRQFNYGQTSDNCRIEAKGNLFLDAVAERYKTITDYPDKDFQQSFGQVYSMTINNITHLRSHRVRVIDAEKSWEEVKSQVESHLAKLLEEEADN
jgi:dTMP kinase